MAAVRGIHGVLARIDELQTLLGGPSGSVGARPDAAGRSFAGALSQATAASEGGASGARAQVDSLIKQAAAAYGVEERLIHAVVRAESDYNPRCVSRAGAMGLMQLMPENCREFGVGDPFDPAQNIDGGVRHLKQMLDRFDRLDLALAGYNAGPGAVRRYGGIPPYRETQAYVQKIMGWLSEG